jgi:hypothetical protein
MKYEAAVFCKETDELICNLIANSKEVIEKEFNEKYGDYYCYYEINETVDHFLQRNRRIDL